MTDVLIRDVPDDVIAARETQARLRFPCQRRGPARFAETFSDLADPDVMSRA